MLLKLAGHGDLLIWLHRSQASAHHARIVSCELGPSAPSPGHVHHGFQEVLALSNHLHGPEAGEGAAGAHSAVQPLGLRVCFASGALDRREAPSTPDVLLESPIFGIRRSPPNHRNQIIQARALDHRAFPRFHRSCGQHAVPRGGYSRSLQAAHRLRLRREAYLWINLGLKRCDRLADAQAQGSCLHHDDDINPHAEDRLEKHCRVCTSPAAEQRFCVQRGTPPCHSVDDVRSPSGKADDCHPSRAL
mmetsp:Transcript_105580/g.192596  ORF Transcript_105580/g.192596 Transcript_105580/m.192596 type:complete len:247 (-) Transcript_105580:117-857(-)